MNFYAPDDLRTWIEKEMRRIDQSKTRVIVGTIEEVRRAQDHTRTSPAAHLQGF